MSKTQRTVTACLWGVVVASLLALLAMQRWQARTESAQHETRIKLKAGEVLEVIGDGQIVAATQRADPFKFDAPAFKLTDQENAAFDSDALRGKVWTASFFFSQCQGVCPGMMGRIQALARVTNDPSVHFVYFTVDPERDTPARLHEYATQAKADATQWHMLTGSADEMHRIAKAFYLPYSVPSEHSGKIMLVDQKGKVQGFYESRDADAMLKLAADVKRVVAGEALQ